jgi:hypothetical protein
MPSGATLSLLVLVVGDSGYRSESSQVKRPNANDASLCALLGHSAICSGRLLGHYNLDPTILHYAIAALYNSIATALSINAVAFFTNFLSETSSCRAYYSERSQENHQRYDISDLLFHELSSRFFGGFHTNLNSRRSSPIQLLSQQQFSVWTILPGFLIILSGGNARKLLIEQNPSQAKFLNR